MSLGSIIFWASVHRIGTLQWRQHSLVIKVPLWSRTCMFNPTFVISPMALGSFCRLSITVCQTTAKFNGLKTMTAFLFQMIL